MQLQSSYDIAVTSFWHPDVEDDILVGSTLYVEGINGGID